MQFKTIAAAAALATIVSAYEVVAPTLNSTVAKGKKLTIDWTSVDTDADVFSVYITNFQTAHWPPTVLSLAQNVPRDDGSIDLTIPCDLSSDYGWQINFINGTNTYVIYAQSPVFSLTGDCVDPKPVTSTAVPYPTATGYNTTVHVTATTAVCTSVATVVYSTPIVWFVEPSKPGYQAPPPKETVTVYAQGPAPVVCSAGGKPSTLAPGSYPTGPAAGGPSPSKPAGGNGGNGNGGYPATTPVGGSHGTTVPVAAPTGAYTTKPVAFTGAAASVKVSGAMAVMIGAVAFLL